MDAAEDAAPDGAGDFWGTETTNMPRLTVLVEAMVTINRK
jgi:hypothetical protein